MTIVSVPKNVWTTIVTAGADTIIENLGHSEVFITTETPSLTGFKSDKLTITTLQSGQTARVYSVNKPTEINHFAVSSGGATDLTYTAATRLLESSTGTDVTLPLVGADAGLMTAADKTKLDGIASGATGPSGSHVPVVVSAGEFIGNSLNATALGTQAQVANRNVIGLFVPDENITIDQLGVSISTFVASATLKLVIYATDSNGRPTTILRETATIDAGSNGTKFANITSLALTAGSKYWVGLRSSSTATVRTLGVGAAPAITYTNAATPVMESSLILTETYASAAANWTYEASQHSNVLVPLILMRVA